MTPPARQTLIHGLPVSSPKRVLILGFVAVCILIFIVAITHTPHTAQPADAFADAFEVVSGPQVISLSNFWIVRHKITKSEFIFVERSTGGILLEPLYSQSGENAGLGFLDTGK